MVTGRRAFPARWVSAGHQMPRGGQDGAAIQKSGAGARTAAVVCGTRYIHTVTESIDKGDLQATIDLLAAWLPTVG